MNKGVTARQREVIRAARRRALLQRLSAAFAWMRARVELLTLAAVALVLGFAQAAWCLAPTHKCIGPFIWWHSLSEGDQAQWAAGVGTLLAIYITQRIASRDARERRAESRAITRSCTLKYATQHEPEFTAMYRRAQAIMVTLRNKEWPRPQVSIDEDLDILVNRNFLLSLMPDDEHVAHGVVEAMRDLVDAASAWEGAVYEHTTIERDAAMIEIRVLKPGENPREFLKFHAVSLFAAISDLRKQLDIWN